MLEFSVFCVVAAILFAIAVIFCRLKLSWNNYEISIIDERSLKLGSFVCKTRFELKRMCASSSLDFESVVSPTGALLGLELITQAAGKNLAFSSPSGMNKTQHKIAEFFVHKCWMRLDRMLEAETFIMELFEDAATRVLGAHDVGRTSSDAEILQQLFQPVESYIKSDPILGDEFEKYEITHDAQNYKMYFEERVNPGLAAWEWLNNEDIQKMIVHLLFLVQQKVLPVEKYYQQSITAKAILILARQTDARPMTQKFYEETVAEYVAGHGLNRFIEEGLDILSGKLRYKFESTAELKDKFLMAMNEASRRVNPTTESDLNNSD